MSRIMKFNNDIIYNMLVSDFDYDLPEERIAKFPPEERGSTRMLVLDHKTGHYEDSYYRDLDQFLHAGDVLILNDTRVMQSRLFCVLPDGRARELVVLEKHGNQPQRVMYRGKLHEGDVLTINGSVSNITITHILGNGIAEVKSNIPLSELAEKYGTVPLPPYLHRDATEADKSRYQTVWANETGSAAAPTASLNMTEDLLKRLTEKGVIIKYLTLHVGLGTFLPIRSDNVEDHEMHSEWFHIPDDTLREVERIRRVASPEGAPRPQPCEDGGGGGDRTRRPRIIAVGTTVARTLEYYAKTGQTSGEDNIFIYPGFQFQIVDALLTNFHAPKSTVLMLASAFASWEHLHAAYDHCTEAGYNFLSYGDSMFIC